MLNWFARLYLWACRRLYNEFAWTYDWVSWLVSLGHWWGWRLSALEHVRVPDAGVPRVLEVGFGTGDLLVEMARRGWDVWGLDLSPAMQRVTAGKLRQHGVWVPRTRAQVQAMPFPDGAFDAVVSTFPAEFIAQLPALREFARVLRPGGRLVVVGAFLSVGDPRLQKVVQWFFGSAVSEQHLRLRDFLAQVGLQAAMVERDGRVAGPPTIVAERPDVE